MLMDIYIYFSCATCYFEICIHYGMAKLAYVRTFSKFQECSVLSSTMITCCIVTQHHLPSPSQHPTPPLQSLFVWVQGFKIPHVGEIMQYLHLYTWLISLAAVFFAHLCCFKWQYPLFLKARVPGHTQQILWIRSSSDGQHGSHILAMVNNFCS
jgi:hypothetical protein